MRLVATLVLSLTIVFPALLQRAAATEPITSIPYRIDYNGWFTIKVAVNGRGPYDFIVDTGATQSLVFQNLADEQGMQPTGGPDQTVLGLAAAGAFPPHHIGDLQVGNVLLDDLVSVVLPNWNVENRPHGIIGLDFLRRYIVVFDADASMLHFYPPGEPPTTVRRWRRTQLKGDNFGLDTDELFTLNGRINNKRVRLLVDLGASGTIVNRAAVSSIVRSTGVALRVRPPSGMERTRITDALQRIESAKAIEVHRIQVGRHYWYNRILGVQDAEIFNELNVQYRPFGLFGADLVRGMSFALDFQGERIYIRK